MREAREHCLEISLSEWPPPYLALDVVHVGKLCVTVTQRRMQKMCISLS